MRAVRSGQEAGHLRVHTSVGVVDDTASCGGKTIHVSASVPVPVHVGRVYIGAIAATTAAAFRALVQAIDHGGEEDETEQWVVAMMRSLLVPVPPGLKARIVLIFSMWWAVARFNAAQRMQEMCEWRW